MINIRIGGVPEHFNLPWHDVIADARDYASTWRDYPGGSGAMIDALASDELDVADGLHRTDYEDDDRYGQRGQGP